MLKTQTTRRAITFPQLCAIARTVLEPDPTITDAEWKAATKDRIARQGYDEPPADSFSRALDAVERAVVKQHGPRRVPPEPPRASVPEDQRPLSRAEAKTILAQLVQRCGVAAPIKTIKPVKRLTVHQADRRIVATMIAGEIVSSIERCEQLEAQTSANRETNDAERQSRERRDSPERRAKERA